MIIANTHGVTILCMLMYILMDCVPVPYKYVLVDQTARLYVRLTPKYHDAWPSFNQGCCLVMREFYWFTNTEEVMHKHRNVKWMYMPQQTPSHHFTMWGATAPTIQMHTSHWTYSNRDVTLAPCSLEDGVAAMTSVQKMKHGIYLSVQQAVIICIVTLCNRVRQL